MRRWTFWKTTMVSTVKRTHRYYTQVQAQMWLCGIQHAFFIVWTMSGKAFYEKIKFDQVFIKNIMNSLSLFYKAYALPCILSYRELFQCPKCEKVILEKEEINNPSTENSICCNVCGTWWHLSCAGLSYWSTYQTHGCVSVVLLIMLIPQ